MKPTIMKTQKLFYITIATCFGLFLNSYGQDKQDNKYNENVTVIGAYQPQLSDARKISFIPEIKDTIIPVPEMDYKIVSVPISYPVKIQPITPSKLAPETYEKLERNFLKAGFGNYSTPYFEYFYQTGRDKKYRAGIHLKHLSSAGKIKDYGFPGQSENLISLFGTMNTGDYILKSKLNYSREAIHYYGFKSDEVSAGLQKNSIRQIYKLFDFDLSGESKLKTETALHHTFGLNYNGLWDEYQAKENVVQLNGTLRKSFNLAKFIKNESFFIDGKFGFYNQEISGKTMSNGLLMVKPYIKMRFDQLELTGGVNATAKLDSLGELLLFPVARLDIYMVPDYLRVFLSLDGNIERNSIRELAQINPFINTRNIQLGFTETSRELKGGVIGGFGGIFNYTIYARNQNFKNLPLFINDTSAFIAGNDTIKSGNSFVLLFDNVDVFNVAFESSLDLSEKAKISANAAYFIYSPAKERKAWQMPLYSGSLRGTYNVWQNVWVDAAVIVYGERYALVNNLIKKLNPVWDFNVGGEYKYSKQLSGFIQFNNFTTKRHFYWNNFPSQRLNVLLGVKYIF